jgi:hypothetical protein
LLGFISDREQFATQRLKTVYSHPSLLRCNPDDQLSRNADMQRRSAIRTLSAIIDAVPLDRYERARKAMIAGYAKDMQTTLRSSFAAIKPGGSLVYVVGNSLHGEGDSSFVIAADLLMAELGIEAGFKVECLEVARQLKRRQVSSHFLRESVVFMKRPNSTRS